MLKDLIIRSQAWFFSSIVTRLIRAPDLTLTSRPVSEPQIVWAPTRHGPVRCYITWPVRDAPLVTSARDPVHINIHGGAFLIGAPRQDDHIVKAIAGETGKVVVNIDYSHTPKVRFPRAHEECFDVLQWVAASGEEQGWDGQLISISGTSAGGNLALGVLEQARRAGGPRIYAGVLIVPAVDVSMRAEDYASDVPRPFVSPAMIRLLQQNYFADAWRRTEMLASPALGGRELSGLPPLLIFGAQHDSLRPQIETFVRKLTAYGVKVDYVCLPGVDHDFQVNKKHAASVMPGVVARMTSHLLETAVPEPQQASQ